MLFFWLLFSSPEMGYSSELFFFLLGSSDFRSDDPTVIAIVFIIIIIFLFFCSPTRFCLRSSSKTARPIWLKFSQLKQNSRNSRRFFHFLKFPLRSWVISPFSFFQDHFCGVLSSVTTETRVNLFGFSERPKTEVVHIGFRFGLSIPRKKLARGWN